jgi:hypothetical protein
MFRPRLSTVLLFNVGAPAVAACGVHALIARLRARVGGRLLSATRTGTVIAAG